MIQNDKTATMLSYHFFVLMVLGSLKVDMTQRLLIENV